MTDKPRIFLIYSPTTVAPSDFLALDSTLGLAYIATVLKANKYEVEI